MSPTTAPCQVHPPFSQLTGAAELFTDCRYPVPTRRTLVGPHASWCFLPNVTARPCGSRESQLLEVFCQMESELAQAGLAFTDVVRTWFAVDGILDWYDSFNRVRNGFFRERGLLGGPIPASTAVGGSNVAGSAVTASVLAVRPRSTTLTRRPVASPRQCEATAYESAFSRAFAVEWPGSYRVYVSGTAAIDAGGRSVHPGDARAQVETTLDVVEQLLANAGLTFAHALDAKAYFRRSDDVHLTVLLPRRGLTAPVACARAEICRDELLFEMELTAGWGPGPRMEGVI